MLAVVGPHLNAPISWPATDPSVESELGEIFRNTSDVHKWPHYFPVYESVLAPLKNRPIRLLEIGVFRGGSLQMWRRYLNPDSVIVGLDIDHDCEQFDDPARNIHVRIGEQQDTSFLEKIIAEFGNFDVIIDDGSHRNGHIIDSFRYLFMHGLKDQGAYIVEDIHSNYWSEWRDRPMSFVDFGKWLIDAMHAHYQKASSEHEFRVGDPKRLQAITVPIVTTLIQKVEFHDSIAVISRGKRELPSCVRNY
jgi:hypothetical protein